MSKKTGIFKHRVVVDVLTDWEDISDLDLERLTFEMNYGEFMGVVDFKGGKELTKEELVNESYEMGGEPGFFGEEFDECE